MGISAIAAWLNQQDVYKRQLFGVIAVVFSVNLVIVFRIPHFRNSFAGKQDDPVSVSYTHLDVYKRQHRYTGHSDKTGKSSKCTVRGSAAKGGNRKSISGKTCYFAGR